MVLGTSGIMSGWSSMHLELEISSSRQVVRVMGGWSSVHLGSEIGGGHHVDGVMVDGPWCIQGQELVGAVMWAGSW